MTSIDEAPQPNVENAIGLPWWSVQRPRVLQLYVGLCWGFTPLALAYARQLIQLNTSVGFTVIATAWVVGHLALVRYAFRSRLIQSARAKLLFLTAVVIATAGAIGIAILVVVPEAIPSRDFGLVTAAPPLLSGSMALVQLSARRMHPRSVDQHP